MTSFIPFRLTVNKQYSETEFNNFCSKHSSVMMVFEISEAGQGHWHGYFPGGLSKSSVVHWLKTELNCKSNADYSMTTKSLKENPGIEGYQRYMCKGDSIEQPPVRFIGMTKQEILEYHNQFYIHRKAWVAKRKIEKMSVKLKLLDYYKEKAVLFNHGRKDHEDVVKVILEFYKESDPCID